MIAGLLAATWLAGAVPAYALDYKVKIEGATDKDLAGDLNNASELKALADKPVDDELALRRRAEADIERLRQAMRARGYYDGTIEFAVDATGKVAQVTVTVAHGKAYRFKDLVITTPAGGGPPLGDRFTPATYAARSGEPAVAGTVGGVDERLVRHYQENGYPKAHIVERRVVVDHADQTMDVTWVLEAGPLGRFGQVNMSGLDRVEVPYVQRRVTFQLGEPYDIRKVEKFRDKLIGSSLFSTVRTDVAPLPDPDGRFVVDVTLQERKPRTVGFGARYETDNGPAALVTWEHRNLFGQGERLSLSALAGQKKQAVTADYRKPDIFSTIDQDGIASVKVENELVDAYESARLKLFGGIERRLSERLVIGGGIQGEQVNVQSRSPTTGQLFVQNYNLLGVPLFLRRDASDDLLNPTRGTRLNITITPYQSLMGTSGTFVQSRFAGSIYQRLTSSDRVVLAAQAAYSSTFGVSLSDLPRDKRFYAGGGGSVRGYAYQRAGRIDSFGDPVGGLSAFESALELRVKVTETIGVVPFVDAGRAFDTEYPDIGQGLKIGTGLGLRYFSAVGPLRLDVATPLNKEKGDDSFQIYVSLGQAF